MPRRFLRALLTRWLARPVRREKNARPFAMAIVKLDRIGDFVLAVSAIRRAIEQYGEDRCLLVVSPQAEPLAAVEFPAVPRLILPAAVGHRRLLAESREARAKLAGVACAEAICFRHQRWDWDELVLLWLGAARCHVLDDAPGRDYFAARNTFRFAGAERMAFSDNVSAAESRGAKLCRELEMHRQLLRAAFGGEVALEDVLPAFTRIARAAARGGVAVLPFGSAAIRDFPEPLLVAALRHTRAKTAAPIALHGDASQRTRLLALAERLRAAGVAEVACAPPTSVVEFAEAIAGAELVITVETSAAHLAAAFDRPAVVLIGGGNYGQFGPWRRSARQVWVTHEIECFGCGWRCIHPEPYCMTRVTPGALEAAIASALHEGAST
ncbi:MAG TPA: glycosyltransferase family 9 protein [Opitutaceae bacterium]|nr:glycosyltransferase family 9 protein [Opitutaceae bacterium]